MPQTFHSSGLGLPFQKADWPGVSLEGFCPSDSATSERTTLFMVFCMSQVARWTATKLPPATHSQFLLIQL